MPFFVSEDKAPAVDEGGLRGSRGEDDHLGDGLLWDMSQLLDNLTQLGARDTDWKGKRPFDVFHGWRNNLSGRLTALAHLSRRRRWVRLGSSGLWCALKRKKKGGVCVHSGSLAQR